MMPQPPPGPGGVPGGGPVHLSELRKHGILSAHEREKAYTIFSAGKSHLLVPVMAGVCVRITSTVREGSKVRHWWDFHRWVLGQK